MRLTRSMYDFHASSVMLFGAGMSVPAETKLSPVTGRYAEVREPEVLISVYAEGGKIYAEGERSARVVLSPVG